MRSLFDLYTEGAKSRCRRAFEQEKANRPDLAGRNWAAAERYARARWTLLVELDRADLAKEVA